VVGGGGGGGVGGGEGVFGFCGFVGLGGGGRGGNQFSFQVSLKAQKKLYQPLIRPVTRSRIS